MEPYLQCDRLKSLFRALLQNLFGKIVANLRIVSQHFVIGELEQLRVAFAQSLADALLHARIIQFALSGRFSRNQFVDCVANSALRGPCSAVYRQHIGDLSDFQFVDRRECCRISLLQG